jgi:peptide/nickel transport system permease protein
VGSRRHGGLASGLALLATLVVVALAAPLLATAEPWIARSEVGLEFPAFDPRISASTLDAAPDLVPVLRAPIPYDPQRLRLDRVLQPPSRTHLLGTDGLGRDIAARVVHGARVSVAVGVLSALLALVVGVPLGAIAGYFRGAADAAVSRAVEAVLCFPTLLLLLALLAAAPTWLRALPDAVKIALVLGVTGWVPVARYLRGEFLRLGGSDVVAAARAGGAGHLRVISRHLLPSALAPVLITAAFTVAAAIGLEAALSFLGLGVQPPTPTWGGLLTEARTHIHRAWWLALFPGVALFATLTACNLVGDGIRDLLDPHARQP